MDTYIMTVKSTVIGEIGKRYKFAVVAENITNAIHKVETSDAYVTSFPTKCEVLAVAKMESISGVVWL